jgi:acetylornithine/N-succinyldiaminopimelate aminotransferase
LLVNAPRPHILRFMPALNVSVQEIDAMLDILRGAIEAQTSASSAA